jgi:hypothetical protein
LKRNLITPLARPGMGFLLSTQPASTKKTAVVNIFVNKKSLLSINSFEQLSEIV